MTVTTSFCGHCASAYQHVVGTPWDPRCCDYAIKQTVHSANRQTVRLTKLGKTNYEQTIDGPR